LERNSTTTHYYYYYYYYYFEGCKHGRIYPILLVESFACLIQSMLQKKGLGFKGYQELSGKERVLGFRVF
jgi:hypothetical protein